MKVQRVVEYGCLWCGRLYKTEAECCRACGTATETKKEAKGGQHAR